ncbi:MAG TPA: efflux RND transporter permease subunit [Bryobacteraceae bacterium]|nr:efflux RND transporter permease subunit [Bryobacteraceae bacterium]
MWIVNIALKRPYTFIVMALLILIISPLVIQRTPVDIFPNVDIPVVAALWNYTGLDAEDMEERITSQYERSLSTVVTDIDHIESQTVNGRSIIKVYFHPGTRADMAMSQLTAVAQSTIHQMPPGATPPFMMVYNASSVPILQLALSGEGLSEQQLFDYAANFVRTQLATVKGAAVPWPYGGKQRQIMIDIQPALLQAKGLSPADIVTAVSDQNLILPTGTSKIGQFEYDVGLNAAPETVQQLNDLPVKADGNTTIYIHDVAHVRDGFSPQTNIVRRNGQRSTLLSIMKIGDTSTLDIVHEVRSMIPRIAAALPPSLRIEPIADQSLFVRAAVNGVVREAIIAACLTAVMILLFLGSWRSTLIIAISIPLSILTSICVLSALGETINIMTLGGLALAVGILVDDATVTIENIDRNFDDGKNLHDGIMDGAAQIALPALVSTLCICIVFLPMFFFTGVARYLFIPLAEAVVFAMLASYVLSRTLVPTLAMYLLQAGGHHGAAPAAWNVAGRIQHAFERAFNASRDAYLRTLEACIRRRRLFLPVFLAFCGATFLLIPWLGQDFFPTTDAGQFNLHFRAKTGTRIEETARLGDLIETSLREIIPPSELSSVIDNIGLPYSSINTAYSNSGTIGTMDADVLVNLKPGHRPTQFYMHEIRRRLPRQFPGVSFYFLPSDIVSEILNFGLPAPIDVQVSGPDVNADHAFATNLLHQLETVPGAVDLRVHQLFDLPRIQLDVNRTKAIESGFSELSVANSLLVSLSGSFQTTPSYWLDTKTGVTYNVVTQTPQYAESSLGDLENIPISGNRASHPEILGDVVNTTRQAELAVVSHYNIQRAIDIFGNVQDRDLGGVASDIQRIVNANRSKIPRGAQLIVRGQIETMQSSFQGLLNGLVLSIVLVYLLIVVNFQSWLDPFIILTALPAAMAGIILILFVSRTTLSVPALMGAIMSVGVATANSILVISFAKDDLAAHGDPVHAALEAGFTRFRPVLMTAMAMIIGMVPMALGVGEGGEQNAPLGRAVIGGLICATVATLFFVPTVFSLLHRRRLRTDAR